MKKIIFFDMDGTLLHRENEEDNPSINEETKKVLHQVQEKGHLLFIATGRPYAFLDKQVTDFPFDGYVLSNGAVVLYHGELLHHAPLPIQKVKEVVEAFEQRKIEYILQTKDYSYMDESYKILEAFYDRCSVNYDCIIRHFNPVDHFADTCKIEMLPVGEENIEFCRSLEGKDFSMMGNPPYSFELYAKNTSKATGILKVLEKLAIPVEDSYAFGDGKNDIEMFQTVGHSIAMDNASDEVKRHAKTVCQSVDNNGVALQLKEWFL